MPFRPRCLLRVEGRYHAADESRHLGFGAKQICVNAVGPGSIDTDMMEAVNAKPGAMTMVMSRNPLKRIGSQREIGDVAAFLASFKAS